MQNSRRETKIGPVIEINVVQIIGVHGFEVSVPSIKDYLTTSWVLISKKENRFVDEMEDPNISSNVSSASLLKEQAESKSANASEEDEKSSWKRECVTNPSSSSRLETNLVNLAEKPVCFTKRTIVTQKRKWITIPKCSRYSGWSLSSQLSRMVSKLLRHFDQDERQTDGAVHWDTTKPVLVKGLKEKGAEEFSESEWIDHKFKGSNKVRFECCETSQKSLAYIRSRTFGRRNNFSRIDGTRIAA